jgi:hypothetical protein
MEYTRMSRDDLTNHEVIICLEGGAMLGPFKATWSKDKPGDVREFTIEYDKFLHGEPQKRFKFHFHDNHNHTAHSVIVNFQRVTGIYDQVSLH